MDKRIYDNYVIQVAEQGSITKAASALGISQPALSSGLNNLEKEIGIIIFNRRTVPISFTPEGLVYYEYVKRLHVLTDDFHHRIRTMRESAKNHVIIGGPAAYIESFVTDAVIELRKRSPEYRVQIRTSSLDDLIRDASNGELNCFISTSADLPEQFEKKRIKTELVHLVIPKSNPINESISRYQVLPGEPGNTFDYSVLNGQDFIFLEEGQPLQKKIRDFIRDNGIEASNSVAVDQVSTAVSLCLKGAGICFASEEALEGSIKLDNVCIYPLPPVVSGRTIHVAYDRELLMTDACRDLIDILVHQKRSE